MSKFTAEQQISLEKFLQDRLTEQQNKQTSETLDAYQSLLDLLATESLSPVFQAALIDLLVILTTENAEEKPEILDKNDAAIQFLPEKGVIIFLGMEYAGLSQDEIIIIRALLFQYRNNPIDRSASFESFRIESIKEQYRRLMTTIRRELPIELLQHLQHKLKAAGITFITFDFKEVAVKIKSEAPVFMGITFKKIEGKKTICIINKEFVLELSPLQEAFLRVLLERAKENPEGWTSVNDLEIEIKGQAQAHGKYVGRYKATWHHLCRYLSESNFFEMCGIPERDFIECKLQRQPGEEKEISCFRINPLLKLVVEENV